MKRSLIFFFFLLWLGHIRGQETDTRRGMDSVRVYFRQGESRLDPLFRENGTRLRTFTERFRTLTQDPNKRIRGLRVTAGASPEGNTDLNRRLSERRAEAIKQAVSGYFPYEFGWLSTVPQGANWEELIRLVEADEFMPYRREALDVLRYTPEWISHDGKVTDGRKRQLGMIGGGYLWRYLESNFFPELRASTLHVWYEAEEPTVPVIDTVYVSPPVQTDTVYIPSPPEQDTIYILPPEKEEEPVLEVPQERRPFYMAVKTNLLYDALVLPNIGLEFYLGRGWSVAGNWMYTWFKNDTRHRYHRIYGGDLEFRRWLSYGKKPLTGHHIGLYGQLLTYDLEWGGKGYLGDRWSYGGGFSYGYSAPIDRRLNLDFTLGVGYIGGEYYEYIPKGYCQIHKKECYLWKATKRRHWFGPTKAEISLVWLLGRDNYNRKKGGSR